MTPGQLAFWLIRAGLFRTLVPKRLTVEWSESELAYLEAHYCLDGPTYVADKLWRTLNSVKQMAMRLDLTSDMGQYVALSDVAREAGVTPQALRQWVHDRPRYVKLTRHWGGNEVLLPLPMARLYLHANRAQRRPTGWWGSARAAEHIGCDLKTLKTLGLTFRTTGRTDYYDPHEVRQMAEMYHNAPPRTHIRLRDLSPTEHRTGRLRPWLTQHGHPVHTYRSPATKQQAAYTTQDAARAFLSAKGHRDEMVETLLRKALTMQEAHKTLSESDKEE